MALVSGDEELAAGFLAAAAAAGVEVQQVHRAEELRPVWVSAPQVYLGLDVAELVQAAGLRGRPGVGLLARRGSPALSRWSAALDACVIELPDVDGVLMSRLAASAGSSGGELVVLVGAAGGVGVSTSALAVGRALAEQEFRVVVVDLDPLGGGLDLTAGAEQLPGWRWPELAAASGQVGDLGGHLPQVEGLDLLAMPRREGAVPGPAAVASVLASARRWYDVCLVDGASGEGAEAAEALAAASRCWLLVRAELQGLAAGARRCDRLRAAGHRVELVVVAAPAAGVGRQAVEQAVGAPVVAVVPEDRRLRGGVARGERALASGSRRWRRAVRRLAAEVLA